MEKLSFNDLQGKTCVITGGGGVIGKSLAMGLASVGVKTAIIDIIKEAADKVADEIKSTTGSNSIGVVADVLDKKSLEQAREVINMEFGEIHMLVNGAGGNSPRATTQVEKIEKENLNELEKTFYGLDMEGFQKVFDLNFKGTLLPTMVFTRDMLKSGKGSVINISSMNSFRPLTKIPAYSAAKSAINNFTQWLSVHFGKTGIRVNAIAPGLIKTKFAQAIWDNDTLLEGVEERTPMQRIGQPDEIAGMALYLASPASSFATGQVYVVDGGLTIPML